MEIDTLNTLVSSAIWHAEQIDELGWETESLAWGEVSRLEEELAKALSVKEAEGRIARRGAVRAALKASDPVRAQDLVERYSSEKGVPKELRTDLREMLKADTEALSQEFPYAAKHHKPDDIQEMASRLQVSGPFWLAAA